MLPFFSQSIILIDVDEKQRSYGKDDGQILESLAVGSDLFLDVKKAARSSLDIAQKQRFRFEGWNIAINKSVL